MGLRGASTLHCLADPIRRSPPGPTVNSFSIVHCWAIASLAQLETSVLFHIAVDPQINICISSCFQCWKAVGSNTSPMPVHNILTIGATNTAWWKVCSHIEIARTFHIEPSFLRFQYCVHALRHIGQSSGKHIWWSELHILANSEPQYDILLLCTIAQDVPRILKFLV